MSGEATPTTDAWAGHRDGADQWVRSVLVAVAMSHRTAPGQPGVVGHVAEEHVPATAGPDESLVLHPGVGFAQDGDCAVVTRPRREWARRGRCRRGPGRWPRPPPLPRWARRPSRRSPPCPPGGPGRRAWSGPATSVPPELPGRSAVEVQGHVWLRPQDRSGAGGGHGTGERPAHGLGLPGLGDDGQNGGRRRAGRGWSRSWPRSGTSSSEAKWPSLTCWPRQSRSSSTTLTTPGVVEVGHRGIVEGQVAVLPDAQAAEVEGVGPEQTRRSGRTRPRDRPSRRGSGPPGAGPGRRCVP